MKWGLHPSTEFRSRTILKMARYKVFDENGIYFTTHSIIEWLPVFKEKKYFEIVQVEEGLKLQDVMRDLKKHTSKEISRELENAGQKLFLYVMRKAAEREKVTAITRFGRMSIIRRSFILKKWLGRSWSTYTIIRSAKVLLRNLRAGCTAAPVIIFLAMTL